MYCKCTKLAHFSQYFNKEKEKCVEDLGYKNYNKLHLDDSVYSRLTSNVHVYVCNYLVHNACMYNVVSEEVNIETNVQLTSLK